MSDSLAEKRYESEKEFFDRQASERPATATPKAILERYANPPHPHLFGKEMMFYLLGKPEGKRVLEVGCGEGQASVQLAYCGADVTGLDISSAAIAAAQARAELDGVQVRFMEANLETDSLGEGRFDVVWCDMILHHVVPQLDRVMSTIHTALRPGGMFIAREPLAYAAWLKSVRRAVPLHLPETPDEQPLRPSELAIMKKHFPRLNQRYYRLFARLDMVTQNLAFVRMAARLDNLLFGIPGVRGLAGDILVWGTKE